MLESESLPGCCGAYVITDFEEIGDGEYYDCRNDAKDALLRELFDLPRGKLIVATLIDQQLHNGWLSILHEVGFHRVARWINSNHGNACNMYVLELSCNPAPKYKGRGK